jgi:hypothetical protein
VVVRFRNCWRRDSQHNPFKFYLVLMLISILIAVTIFLGPPKFNSFVVREELLESDMPSLDLEGKHLILDINIPIILGSLSRLLWMYLAHGNLHQKMMDGNPAKLFLL